MDANKCLKISDFGLARNFGSPSRNMSHQAVTRVSLCPQLSPVILKRVSGIVHPSFFSEPKTMGVLWTCGLLVAYLRK